MKQNKIKNLLLTILALLLGVPAFAQVGVGTGTPEGVLDVKNSTQGIVLPKVQSIDSVKAPDGGEAVTGTLVYDLSRACARVKENTRWSGCILDSSGIITYTSEVLDLGANFKVAKASVSSSWAVLIGQDHMVYFSGSPATVSGLGRIGTGGGVRSYTLVLAEPMADIAAGVDHAIAADSLGRVWAWGSNAAYKTGQSVTGSFTALPDTVDFFGPTKGAGYLAKLVAASNASSFVVTDNGDVYSLTSTAIESGRAAAAGSPIGKVNIPEKVVQISASLYQTVGVITETGKVYVWGEGTGNGLGNGGTTDATAPIQLTFSEPIGKIAMGYQCGAAITADGKKIYAWGAANTHANAAAVLTPQDITSKIQGFDASKGHLIIDVGLARSNGGNITVVTNKRDQGAGVYVAGRNTNGQLGVGNTYNQYTNVAAPNGLGGTNLKPISTLRLDANTQFKGVASGGYNTILITGKQDPDNPDNSSPMDNVAYGAGRAGSGATNRVLGAITTQALYFTPLTK